MQSVVSLANLGREFDVGAAEAGKVCLKLGPSLARQASGEIEVVAAPAQFYLCQIWAEENGDFNAHNWEWSFGNGKSPGTSSPGHWGVVLPWPGHIVALSLGVRVSGGGVTEVAACINQVRQATVVMMASASKAWNTEVLASFAAGDVLNFQTVRAGGAMDGVMSAVVRYVVG